MHKIIISFILIILFSSVTHVFAEDEVVYVVKNNYQLKSGDQYYSYSVHGLRSYLNDIQYEKPDVYQRMNPLLVQYENQEMSANFFGTTFMLGALGGTGYLGYAVSTGQFDPDKNEGRTLLYILGLTTLYITSAIIYASGPGYTEFREFVNKHNSMIPQMPLIIDIGVNSYQNEQNVYVNLIFVTQHF